MFDFLTGLLPGRAKGCLCVLTAALVTAFTAAAATPALAGGGPLQADVDGLRVITQRAEGELAAVCVYVGVGSAHEATENNGITAVLNRLIISAGTSAEGSAALAIERLGGQVQVETTAEYSLFTLTVPVKNLSASLAALGGAVTAPAQGDAPLGALKRRLLGGGYAVESDAPVELGYRLLMSRSHPDSPYGLRPRGESGAIGRLSARDVSDWHGRYYVRGNTLVSICAPVEEDTALKAVKSAFAGLVPGPAAAGGRASGGAAGGVQKTLVDCAGGQPAALVGYSSPPAGSSDYAAVKVVEAAVAGGMGSSLFRELRVGRKTAYSFGSINPPMRSGSVLAFYVSADEKCIGDAVDGVLRSVGLVSGGGLTDAEIARARGWAAGRLALECEGAVGRARMNGLAVVLGAGPGYWDSLAGRIGSVDAADTLRAARKYMGSHTRVVMRPGGGGS